MTSKCKR